MMSPHLLIWLPLAWLLPALLAHALGWSGVWGGAALPDLLWPLPVAGGALHVPSFVLCAVLVKLIPGASDRMAVRLQALLLGLALAGLLWLLRLDGMWVSWRSDGHWPGWRWASNPVGLFLLCDATLALLVTARWPSWSRLRDPVAAVLLAFPLVAPIAMAARSGLVTEPFLMGHSRPGQVRGDEVLMIYTSLDMQAPDFQHRALTWADRYHPSRDLNADDTAVLFVDSLEAAQRMETTRARHTLCLYEDGTPPLWSPGGQPDACFRHVSFQERLMAARAAQAAGRPEEVAAYLARSVACEATSSAHAGQSVPGREVSALHMCAGLLELRERLSHQYPGMLEQAR